jgi:hypothetical protein
VSERWGALPLGELHAEDRCAWCGHGGIVGPIRDREGENEDADLYRTVHPMTLAPCVVCVDTVACERRRYYKNKRI